MNRYEENKKIKECEDIGFTEVCEWYAEIYPKVSITQNPDGWHSDGTITHNNRKLKIEWKIQSGVDEYNKYNKWVLNAEKIIDKGDDESTKAADIFWLKWPDGYVVTTSRQMLDKFVKDYGEKAFKYSKQRKTQVDLNSEIIEQKQLYVPHSEVNKYFKLYKGTKRVNE